MNQFNYSLMLPVDKAGEPDHRFSKSLERIRDELTDQTINELIEFHTHAQQLQKGYSKQGLAFASAVFKEAANLDQNHRFDDDNRYGYKSKVLRKQAQQTLERLGFSKNNSHKLVATAAWLTCRCPGKDELKWFETLSTSHLYELSRMSSQGYGVVQEEVSYPDFKFCAGQQSISVRRLEQIRRSYPKQEVPSSGPATFPESPQEQSKEVQQVHRHHALKTSSEQTSEPSPRPTDGESDQINNAEMLELFTLLAQSIDWEALGECAVVRRFQELMTETLNCITELTINSSEMQK
tara:strand:+ start:125 stop:1006 length:882 start_codon:yes stop_codon:yes gene_type:complete